MTSSHPITLHLDRRLLEHPRAYHLRRMRAGIWLYLDLLARLPAGADTLEVEPAAIGRDMGLPEGTVRSWLGHLRSAGYLQATRLNGSVRVTLRTDRVPLSPAAEAPEQTDRFFTRAKLARALGEVDRHGELDEVLSSYSDDLIRQALAETLAVPSTSIRHSRTALFRYLLKKYAHDS